jgi:hypothetical protein
MESTRHQVERQACVSVLIFRPSLVSHVLSQLTLLMILSAIISLISSLTTTAASSWILSKLSGPSVSRWCDRRRARRAGDAWLPDPSNAAVERRAEERLRGREKESNTEARKCEHEAR